MIGVIANENDLEIAAEFFELFKTPWEKADPKKKYRVVLSTDSGKAISDAELLLAYGAGETDFDRQAGVSLRRVSGPADVEWDEWTFPIYGALATFDGIEERESGGPTFQGRTLEYRRTTANSTVWRIGYDLFGEIRHLLTEGQPASRALVPTLELHIALLRRTLREGGIPFVEIPPRPEGYDFICCLTHDVDFYGIRRHFLDRTMLGFLHRALVGSVVGLARGERSWGELARNWAAVLKLPLIYLGLARDFWSPFEDYREVEKGLGSTFFVVPFKGRPGTAPDGGTDPARAVPYGACELSAEIREATARGCEVAVHGIDAWRDAEAGGKELAEVAALTDAEGVGVRMHWLYWNGDSPRRLEEAGFDYDSTRGYNDAVGYRAGTSQAFRPPATENLMELPLSIMDTALFYPDRMGLGRDEAMRLCRALVRNARRFGGALVINWHGRSLAPERLWGRFYEELLDEIRQENRVWFASAREAVAWFRRRRAIQETTITEGSFRIRNSEFSSLESGIQNSESRMNPESEGARRSPMYSDREMTPSEF